MNTLEIEAIDGGVLKNITQISRQVFNNLMRGPGICADMDGYGAVLRAVAKPAVQRTALFSRSSLTERVRVGLNGDILNRRVRR